MLEDRENLIDEDPRIGCRRTLVRQGRKPGSDIAPLLIEAFAPNGEIVSFQQLATRILQ
jgi:hypothetical protein